MSFLLPAFLGAAALMGLPIVLHLLRLQPRRRIAFPSLRFLGRDALRDSNRHRLLRWLVLLLRCLAILLVVAAFARPFWRFEHSERSRAVVVLVDNSYSMVATGRREAVEAWLAPQLASLRRPDQLGVLLLRPSPTWLVPLGDDLEAGRAALKTLPQAYETSGYRAGLELAGAKLALSTASLKQILIAGDEQRLAWSSVRFDRTLPPGVQVLAAPPTPLPKHQAAITGLKVLRTNDGKLALDATVRGYVPASEERSVTFFAGERKLGTERVVLTVGRVQTVHAEYPVPDPDAPQLLRATLDPDELPIDDTAYAALAASNDRRVMLAPGVANDADYLAIALNSVEAGTKLAGASDPAVAAATGAAISLHALPKTEPLATFRIEPLPEGRAWAPSSVAVLRGVAPFRSKATATLDAFLLAGGSAWIICDGSPEQTAWLASHGIILTPAKAQPGERLKLRDLTLEHPLFAPFAGHSIAPMLAPVFQRGWAFDGPAVEPLARWTDRSIAIAEVPVGEGRMLLTGFRDSRADSTFPVEAAFVPFVHQAVLWLTQNRVATPTSCRVGDTLVLPGSGIWRAAETPRPVAPANVDSYVVPSIPGLYVFEQQDAPKRYYAVNLDAVESDLTPWPSVGDFQRLVSKDAPPAATPAKAVVRAGRPQTILDQSLVDERQAWWWLLAAALLVLLAELALANRTIP